MQAKTNQSEEIPQAKNQHGLFFDTDFIRIVGKQKPRYQFTELLLIGFREQAS